MLRSLVLGTVSAIGLVSAAGAADMYRGEPMGPGGYKDGPYVPVATWTGFYLGLNAGGTWNSNDIDIAGKGGAGWNPYFPDPFRKRSVDGSGFAGGGQIGYNHQFGTYVLGFEADISKLDGSASLTTSGPGPNDPYKLRLSQDVDWLATVRGRLGFTPNSRTLAYVTAGLAVGGISHTSNLDFPVTHYDAHGSDTKVGWTVGGGLEYAISPAWSLKGEYLYYDLGNTTLNANPSPANPPFTVRTEFEDTGHIVRAGLNYHVGGTYEPLK